MLDTYQVAAPITAFSDGSFEPAEFGPDALQFPVTDSEGKTIDIVAWLAHRPESWWLRRRVGQILGERDAVHAGWIGEAMHLFPTPAAWMNANVGFSACILDWRCDPRFLFPNVLEVRCATPDLYRRLHRRILECAAPAYKITVGEQ